MRDAELSAAVSTGAAAFSAKGEVAASRSVIRTERNMRESPDNDAGEAGAIRVPFPVPSPASSFGGPVKGRMFVAAQEMCDFGQIA